MTGMPCNVGITDQDKKDTFVNSRDIENSARRARGRHEI
jgi:uncharacterized protein (DUF302 family)